MKKKFAQMMDKVRSPRAKKDPNTEEPNLKKRKMDEEKTMFAQKFKSYNS